MAPDRLADVPTTASSSAIAVSDRVTDQSGADSVAQDVEQLLQAVVDRLGPDPLVDDLATGEERFVAIVRKKPTPIALLLMDQAVISGIGNVYRAEMLFRARQNPFTPGRDVLEPVVRALWRDWVRLLAVGFETGLMYTMDDEGSGDPKPEHWVYQRTGEPCRGPATLPAQTYDVLLHEGEIYVRRAAR